MSGQGISGYLSKNMLIAYPMEDGQCLWSCDDLDDEGRNAVLQKQLALQRCFVDAMVYVDGDPLVGTQRPRIGDLSKSGDTLLFSLFVGASATRISVSGATNVRFPIVSGAAEWGRYVVVLSSEGIRDVDFSLYGSGTPSSPEHTGLYLCAKCVSFKPQGLSSLMVYNGWEDYEAGPHYVLRGDVRILPGNNIRLSSPDDGSGIRVSAVPGAGTGQLPCISSGGEDDSAALPIFSPDGHTRLFNDTCYDIEPIFEEDAVTKEVTGFLKIHPKCTACCTCDMYASIVNDRLGPLFDIVLAAKTRMGELLSSYETNVRKFNARMAKPVLSDIQMTLSAAPSGKYLGPRLSESKVRGRMGRCAFTAVIRNSSYFNIRAQIMSMYGSDTIAEASASWTDENGASCSRAVDTSLSGSTFTVLPGRSLVVTFVSVKNAMVGAAGADMGFTGSISAAISYKGSSGAWSGLGTLTKSVGV